MSRRARRPARPVALGVLWRDHVCFLFHSRPGQPLEESIGRHELHPADRSSAGLALLAHARPRPEAKVPHALVLAEPVVPVADLEAALEGVRELGYARLRVPEKGLLSVGLAVGDPPVGALAVSGPWAAAERSHVVALLRDTRDRILAALATARPPAPPTGGR